MATDSRANNGDSKSDVESRQGIPFLGRLDPTAAYAHQHNHTVRRLVYFVLGCSSLTVAEKGIALLVMLARRLSCLSAYPTTDMDTHRHCSIPGYKYQPRFSSSTSSHRLPPKFPSPFFALVSFPLFRLLLQPPVDSGILFFIIFTFNTY